MEDPERNSDRVFVFLAGLLTVSSAYIIHRTMVVGKDFWLHPQFQMLP